MIPRYVLDTGALVSVERGKQRAARFLVMATAALLDAIVLTGGLDDFVALRAHFPRVVVLAA